MNHATTIIATGHRQVMTVAMVPLPTPSACPAIWKSRHGDGMMTHFVPPSSGFSAASP